MKPTILIAFAVGAVLGAAGGYLFAPKADPDGAGEKSRIAVLEKELSAKSAELKKLTGTGAATAKAADGKTVSGDLPQPAAFETEKFKEMQKRREAKMKKMLADKVKLKVDEKLAVLRRKLGLTEEQASAMRPLLEKQLAGSDLMSLMMGMQSEDDLSPEERKAKGKELLLSAINPAKAEAELDAQLAGMLTPEQRASYASLKQEQRANSVEIAANKELGKLQGAVTLTTEQKDQAFDVLTKLANENLDKPIPSFIALAAMEPGGAEHMKNEVGEEGVAEVKALAEEAKARKQRRLEAMKGILTPEQFSVYEAQQKDPSADLSEAMSELGGGMMMHMDMDEEATEAVPGTPASNDALK